MVVSRAHSASPTEEPARAPQRRGRALPAHVHDAAALLRRDARCACSSPRTAAMGSSLHPLAASDELDLGAFLYAIRRLPDGIVGATLVVMGQDARSSPRNGIADRGVGRGRGARAPAPLVRRRRGDAGGAAGQRVGPRRPDPDARRLPDRVEQDPRAAARGRLAARPTTPAPGVRARRSAAPPTTGRACAAPGATRFDERLGVIAERRLNLRVRMLGGAQVGYARMTRRWWTPVHDSSRRAGARPTGRSTSSPPTRTRWSTSSPACAREREAELDRASSRRCPRTTSCATELERFREGRSRGLVGELPLLRRARSTSTRTARRGASERRGARAGSRRHAPREQTALRVSAQVIPLAQARARAARPAARRRRRRGAGGAATR